jgi:mRNA interferase RelE/StbE
MERLPAEVYDRLEGAILALADEPRPPGCVKLKGREGWHIRVGDYRIVYGIDDE